MKVRSASSPRGAFPHWLTWLVPVAALAGLLVLLAVADLPQALRADLPPLEILSFERIDLTDSGFRAVVVNGGPVPVTIAQVTVDDAFWGFTIDPGPTLPRLGRATITIPYPWVFSEPHRLRLLTSTGLTFDGEVQVAVETPTQGLDQLVAYALVGGFVGIVPVALGLLFYPAMRGLGRKALNAILALTVGMLAFLLIDTGQEALEVAGHLPGVLQGVALVLLSALLTWLALLAVASRRRPTETSGGMPLGLYVAWMIAFGIGLHNLGEGMAIGAAFTLGEAGLGSFLIVGFTLHNITEGVGIAAPLAPGRTGLPPSFRPGLRTFVGLTLLAGAPAIVGAWVGGFAFSFLVAAVALGVGLGAIWQVIIEVGRLLRDDAARHGEALVTWPNLLGFAAGAAVMYVTALLVTV